MITDLPIWLQVAFWWCVALSLLTGALVVSTLRRQRRQRKAQRALTAATLAHIETQRHIDQALDLASDTPVHDRLMVEWFARELDDEAVVAAWIEESA